MEFKSATHSSKMAEDEKSDYDPTADYGGLYEGGEFFRYQISAGSFRWAKIGDSDKRNGTVENTKGSKGFLKWGEIRDIGNNFTR